MLIFIIFFIIIFKIFFHFLDLMVYSSLNNRRDRVLNNYKVNDNWEEGEGKRSIRFYLPRRHLGASRLRLRVVVGFCFLHPQHE